MHTSLSLLITISVLAGFFMRPLNQFVFSKLVLLVKYTNSKPIVILIMFASILTAFAVTISAIYFSLKLSGFIPLEEHTPTFVVSFFIGSMLWMIYARLFNRGCRIDLNQDQTNQDFAWNLSSCLGNFIYFNWIAIGFKSLHYFLYLFRQLRTKKHKNLLFHLFLIYDIRPCFRISQYAYNIYYVKL